MNAQDAVGSKRKSIFLGRTTEMVLLTLRPRTQVAICLIAVLAAAGSTTGCSADDEDGTTREAVDKVTYLDRVRVLRPGELRLRGGRSGPSTSQIIPVRERYLLISDHETPTAFTTGPG
jgi:hypothetical protein